MQISEAFRYPGEDIPFRYDLTAENQEFGGRPLEFLAPLSVDGVYRYDGDAIVVEGNVSTTLNSVCARCAEEFPEPLSFTFSERFLKPADVEADTDDYSYDGDTLNPDQAVMDNLYLNVPIISYCRPDCKGLCPVCGSNRNLSDCGCPEPGLDNAFAILKNEF